MEEQRTPLDIFALTCAGLGVELKRRYGKGVYHARALCREVFKRGNRNPLKAEEFEVSPKLTQKMEQDLAWPDCRIVSRLEDEVLKYATRLEDGAVIESVVIPAQDRLTLCISSQVGCRMGCRFCTTGSMGLIRNLRVAEIVWQVWAARFELGYAVDNIVFMGMGEPFDNFDNVIQAISVMNDQRGMNIGLSSITVSTCGLVDGIRHLAALNMPSLHLALSLNAVTDDERSAIMPINKRYPLAALKQALHEYPLNKKGAFMLEYVLLAGLNDTHAHAVKLIEFADGLPVRVNVIAYNGSTADGFHIPSEETVVRFCTWLRDAHIFAMPRASRGSNIQAACGQLGATLKKT